MKIETVKLQDQKEIVLLEHWSGKDFDLDMPGWQYPGSLAVEAKVKRDAAIVEAQVQVKAQTCLICSRCHKEFSKNLDQDFRFIYPYDLSQKVLCLDEDIRSELILAAPQKILCSEVCKGLCSRCGADLNEEKCHCKVA